MRVTLLLADSAQAVAGKLYILGGGWSVTGPEPSPSALALKIEVPWDQSNIDHNLLIELLDADGHPVELPTPDGDQPMRVESSFVVGRPPEAPPGTPLDIPLAINFGPLPLEPGGRYQWRVWIDGETEEGWQLGFSTRRAIDGAGPGGIG